MREQYNNSKSQMLNTKFNSVTLYNAKNTHSQNLKAKHEYFEQKYSSKIEKTKYTIENMESAKSQELKERLESNE